MPLSLLRDVSCGTQFTGGIKSTKDDLLND